MVADPGPGLGFEQLPRPLDEGAPGGLGGGAVVARVHHDVAAGEGLGQTGSGGQVHSVLGSVAAEHPYDMATRPQPLGDLSAKTSRSPHYGDIHTHTTRGARGM